MEKSGLTLEQERKIKYIVYDEFFGSRIDYIICRNRKGVSQYIHESKLNLENDYTPLSKEDAEEYRKRIHEEKINSLALSPIELSYKKMFLRKLSIEDEKIYGKVTGDKVRKTESIHSSNYYSLTFFEKLTKHQFSIFIFIILLNFGAYYYFSTRKTLGTIFIKGKHEGTKAFLNEKLFLLDSNQTLKNISDGHYTLKIVNDSDKVFETEIDIYGDKSIYINFTENVSVKNPTLDAEKSYVKIVSNQTIFVSRIDKEIVPANKWIPIMGGKSYTFEASKEHFQSLPPFRSFYLSERDSLEIRFQLNKIERSKKFYRGTIEVGSNIQSAEVFINGKATGNSTTYFFNDLAKGTYAITVKKKGYRNISGIQKVTLTEGKTYQNIEFKLEKSANYVTINTRNRSGEIFIDGTNYGKGTLVKSLDVGKHSISFGKVDGFYTPKKRNIVIHSDKNIILDVSYFPIINYSATAGGAGFRSKNFSILYGYQQFGRFIEDSEKKPILKKDRNGKNVLVMSYPFPYNNPVSGHAVKLNFNLPPEFNYQQKLRLFLSIYSTSEAYSSLNASKAIFSLIINDKGHYAKQRVKYSREKIATYPKHIFRVNTLLRNGLNEIILMLPNSNTTVLQVRSIELRK